MAPEQIFPIFLGTWIVLALAASLLYQKADLETKRRWHPRMIVGVGVLFVAFAYSMFPSPRTILFLAPITALIQYVNYRFTRFCPSCGKTLKPTSYRMEFCPRCGTRLGGN